MRIKTIALILALTSTTACSITVPVAVVGQKGEILTGQATATMSGGTYSVTNSQLTCGGTFDSGPGNIVPFQTSCDDGRKGRGEAVRDSSLVAGRGTVILSDGETAQFIFGKPAEGMRPAK